MDHPGDFSNTRVPGEERRVGGECVRACMFVVRIFVGCVRACVCVLVFIHAIHSNRSQAVRSRVAHDMVRSLEVALDADALDVDHLSIAGNTARLAALFTCIREGSAVAAASRKVSAKKKDAAGGGDETAPAENAPLPGEDPAQTEARLANDKYSAMLVEKALRLMRCMDASDPAVHAELTSPANLKALVDLFETNKWGAPMSALRVRVYVLA